MKKQLLTIKNLCVDFPDFNSKKLFKPAGTISILRDININIEEGEVVALVGESGSGKTMLGKTILRLHEPTNGSIVFMGTDISHLSSEEMKPLRKYMQIIFQDTSSALNPRYKVSTLLKKPLFAYNLVEDTKEARSKIVELLKKVDLNESILNKYPHQLSGGQRQRVGIVRAIAIQPKFILADEIVSGLDVSTQVSVLNILLRLKDELGLSVLFITHDLSVVKHTCSRAYVLYHGSIVEENNVNSMFKQPKAAYTQSLIDSIPDPVVDPNWIKA